MLQIQERTWVSEDITSQTHPACRYSKNIIHANIVNRHRYRWDVQEDGTWENRKTFAFVDSGVPDGNSLLALWRQYRIYIERCLILIIGVHCDTDGNVYAGCGDGVQVWNPSGKLIGKIYLGATSANFRFAGKGRMVIAAEENLYYATLAATGSDYIE